MNDTPPSAGGSKGAKSRDFRRRKGHGAREWYSDQVRGKGKFLHENVGVNTRAKKGAAELTRRGDYRGERGPCVPRYMMVEGIEEAFDGGESTGEEEAQRGNVTRGEAIQLQEEVG